MSTGFDDLIPCFLAFKKHFFVLGAEGFVLRADFGNILAELLDVSIFKLDYFSVFCLFIDQFLDLCL